MVFVTGGTGLVGSHILLELITREEKVRALKTSSSNTRIINDIFEFYGANGVEKIEWVDGDILDYDSLTNALKGIRHVYHAAAFVSWNPKMTQKIKNVIEGGTRNMLMASAEAGVEKFGYISSIAALGNALNGEPVDETCFWQADDEHYAYSEAKFRAEMEVQRAAAEGMKTVIVNPSFIVGPGRTDRSSGVSIQAIKKGLPFYPSGSSGYVHARDVAKAITELMNSDIVNERFILNGENKSLKYFFDLTAKILNVKPPKYKARKLLLDIGWMVEYLRSSITGTEPTLTRTSARISRSKLAYSNKKIRNAIGFKFRPLEEAVNDTVAFMKKYGY